MPGNPHPKAAYFTRGSGHDSDAKYSEDEKDYKATLDRLGRKLDTARKAVPKPIVEASPNVKAGFISFGSSYEPTREARDRLKAEGMETNHLLLRALPLAEEVKKFVAAHDIVYLVEQNRDGQMAAILKAESPDLGTKIVSILIYDGLPATPGNIVRQVHEFLSTSGKEAKQWQAKRPIASI